MANLSMAEAAPAGTCGEYQKVSAAVSRCKWILTWARLKQKSRIAGTRLGKTHTARAPAGKEKNLSCPFFLDIAAHSSIVGGFYVFWKKIEKRCNENVISASNREKGMQ